MAVFNKVSMRNPPWEPSDMTLRLRTACVDDRDGLIELQRRASLANPEDREAILAHPEAVDIPPGQFEAGDVIVAEQDGVPLGFAALFVRPDGQVELDGLFVEPAHWNAGIGRALVCAAEGRARDLGADSLHVISGPNADGFYARVGFTALGEIPTRFGSGRRFVLTLSEDQAINP